MRTDAAHARSRKVGARPDVVRRGISAGLPVFPWDTLADATALARSHPDGIVDLSVGTPVDPVAPLIREALAAASAAPGYPATAGTPALRASAVGGAGSALRHHRARRGRRTSRDRHQGAHRVAADAAGPRRRRHRRGTRIGLSNLRSRSAAGGRTGAACRLADPDRPADTGLDLSQLAEQPDRCRARRRPPPQGRRMGARTRGDRRVRRVLPRPGLGRRTRLGAAPDRSATATTPACWRFTRCPRRPRWPATAPASSPATAP